jgi:hypothetical protein
LIAVVITASRLAERHGIGWVGPLSGGSHEIFRRDVSLDETAICVVDEDGIIITEGKAASEPEDLARWIAATGLTITRGRPALAVAACGATGGGAAGDLHRDPTHEGRHRGNGGQDRPQ